MTDIDLTPPGRPPAAGPSPLRGYLASPPGTGPWPGVVMMHEIFGLDDVMRGHADRLADLGYLTLAVDLFSAGGAARCLVSTMAAMIRGHGRAFTDICGGPPVSGRFPRLHRQDRRHRLLHRRRLRAADRR